MVLMASCGLLLVIAIALMVRWRHESLEVPSAWLAGGDDRSVGHLLRVYLWLTFVGATAGALAGVLVLGPGARLVMRALAATSPDAQGRITEAQEIVGDISFDGTLALIIFGGLLVGPGGGVVYAVLHRVLPRGILGGLTFGLVTLIAVSTRIDPLRPDNQDFEIVGPGWLATALFGLLALVTGAFVASASGRLSSVLPLPGPWAFVYGPALGLLSLPTLVAFWPAGLVVLVGAVLFVVVRRRRTDSESSGRGIVIVRVALGLMVLGLLPGFASAMIDIA